MVTRSEIRAPSAGELLILVYALWTLSVHLTAFSGGGLRRLCLVFGLGLIAAIAIVVALFRRRIADGLLRIRWWIEASRAERTIIVLLVLSAIVVTATAHRSHADDTHFVSWAVAAVDDRDLPILHFDMTLALPGATLELPVRKVQSYEMLGAALSWLTGISAVTVFHNVLPVIMAPLVVLAYATLFRLAVPRRWLGALVGALVFIAANGQTNFTHGNFSFVRLQHGKAVLVSILLPMILALAIRFARRPTPGRWAMLAAVQICGVGATSTGLWAAPLTAALGLVVGLPRADLRRWIWTLLIGCLASGYVIAAGLYLRLASEIPRYHVELEGGAVQLFVEAAVEFFRSPAILGATAALVLLAVIESREVLARRLCLVSTLGVVLFLANPLVAGVVARNLTSATTYWRVFWLLPLPVIAGIAVSTPLALKAFPGGRRGRCAAFALLLAAVAAMTGGEHVFAASNRTEFRWPSPKVEAGYAIATALRDELGPNATVLAPQSISRWLPMLHHHPKPLLALRRHARIHGEEGFRRLRVKDHVTGLSRLDGGVEELGREITHYSVDAVFLHNGNPWADEIRELLGRLDFDRLIRTQSYEIWRATVGGELYSSPGPLHHVTR
jgi:hypothetical protein